MNTKRFLMAAAAILTIFSCTEKESGNENNGPSGKENTPIVLTADTAAPEMTTETQQDEVLTLSWNATTNMGTGARIEYTVLIDLKDGSFENACEVPVSGTSHAFTAGELNSLLLDEFGCEADEVVEVDMCVLATIKNDAVEDVISNTVTVTLTTFTPKSTNLYLIGNATTANWDYAYAIPMNPIEGEEGGFTWSGELNAGEFKFLVWNTSWEPSYGPDEENPGKLYYREHVKEDPNDPDTFMSTMGCRTLIGNDINGLGYKRKGRGNNTPNTIILPKLGIEYGICLGQRTEPDLDGFWNAFEETLKLAEKGLLERFAIMVVNVSNRSIFSPFCCFYNNLFYHIFMYLSICNFLYEKSV